MYTKVVKMWKKPHLNWLATTSCVVRKESNCDIIHFCESKLLKMDSLSLFSLVALIIL